MAIAGRRKISLFISVRWAGRPAGAQICWIRFITTTCYMSCHIHTIIMSTNAYREKKNCKGLSVMVCNAFVTLADGIWAASSAEDMSLNTPVACQSVALWRDVGGALDGVHKSHLVC